MALRDLITGVDGKLSHAKLWPNVASAVATGMFIFQGVRDKLTLDVWIVYLTSVGGYSAIIQALGAWRGRSNKEGPNGNDQ